MGKFIPVPEIPFSDSLSRIFCGKNNREGTHLDTSCVHTGTVHCGILTFDLCLKYYVKRKFETLKALTGSCIQHIKSWVILVADLM